jgi:HEAT repeat protein
MTFESALDGLADPASRISAQQLTNLSGLGQDEIQQLRDAWEEIPAERRLKLISDLVELAEDNVDLNFDAVYKTALEDEEALVRGAAVKGLYEYEGRDLIGRFAELLREDPDASVRSESAMALGRYALAAELGYLADADVDLVRDVLIESAEDDDEDETVRAKAIEALGALSGEETENLIESLYREESIWLKVGAVDAMGRSCNESWLPLIFQEMENPQPEMRHAAAFAAGEIGDEQAVQPLTRMAIHDPDSEVQLAAIHALGEIGGNQARVGLKSILYEGDDDLRTAIEEAMTNLSFEDDPMRPAGF